MEDETKSHLIDGSWYLTAHENIEKILTSMGCSDIIVTRLVPLLSCTGENGHVEKYTVDLTHRVVRHCTYVNTHLLREFVVPLDVESPAWSLSGKFIKVKVSMLGVTTLVRDETSDDYTLKVVSDVYSDDLSVTWTSLTENTVGLTCKMKFKKSDIDDSNNNENDDEL